MHFICAYPMGEIRDPGRSSRLQADWRDIDSASAHVGSPTLMASTHASGAPAAAGATSYELRTMGIVYLNVALYATCYQLQRQELTLVHFSAQLEDLRDTSLTRAQLEHLRDISTG